MAQAELNDGRKLCAVNDLSIGPRSHISARYLLESGTASEVQSFSWVIVSTGLGSTSWLKCILAGAASLNRLRQTVFGGRPPPKKTDQKEDDGRFSWAADYLCFSVREPFSSRTSETKLVSGRMDAKSPLVITSLMPAHGVTFSDGLENDFLEFNSGHKASITVADKKGCLVV
ncbi:MAG: hypothetical protein LBT47_09600 [Deltaproteobacteria bacterium]|jgi:hypothetical protein|nr:hypothetical protein [Deltaproteobacteria bacterium]